MIVGVLGSFSTRGAAGDETGGSSGAVAIAAPRRLFFE